MLQYTKEQILEMDVETFVARHENDLNTRAKSHLRAYGRRYQNIGEICLSGKKRLTTGQEISNFGQKSFLSLQETLSPYDITIPEDRAPGLHDISALPVGEARLQELRKLFAPVFNVEASKKNLTATYTKEEILEMGLGAFADVHAHELDKGLIGALKELNTRINEVGEFCLKGQNSWITDTDLGKGLGAKKISLFESVLLSYGIKFQNANHLPKKANLNADEYRTAVRQQYARLYNADFSNIPALKGIRMEVKLSAENGAFEQAALGKLTVEDINKLKHDLAKTLDSYLKDKGAENPPIAIELNI